MLRRIRNHNSRRLPPEILATVASHLDEESLINATHVCHFWRSTLLSFSRIWAVPCFTYEEERNTLVFLERSKPLPVSVDITKCFELSEVAMQSLKGITHRLASLAVVYDQFTEDLLIQPFPVLKHLHLVTRGGFPSVASLAPDNLCRLTKLHFELSPDYVTTPRIGDRLIELLRRCPLLENAFFRYDLEGDLEFTTGQASAQRVSLPCLRSFVHESPSEMIPPGLFNRLSLPPTCNVKFTVENPMSTYLDHPWDHGFPAPLDQPYLSDIKKVKVVFDPHSFMIRTIFSNSGNTEVSLDRQIPVSADLDRTFLNILDFVGSSDLAGSVEFLHFEGGLYRSNRLDVQPSREQALNFENLKTLVVWQFDPILVLGCHSSPALWDHVENLVICPPSSAECRKYQNLFLERVQKIAVTRESRGTPLESVSLYLGEEEARLYEESSLSGILSDCVGSVNVIRGDWRWRTL